MFMLADKMKECVGIDITDKHLDTFNEYKSKNNITNCEYKILDVTKSSASEKYDRIISFDVIEHLSDENGIKFYVDSLTDDGILAITVPNKWWLFETHGAKLSILPWNRVPFFSWLPRPIHERFANAKIYTKRRITRLLENYGLQIIEAKYITAPMDVLPNGKFKNWMIDKIFNSDTTIIPFKATAIFVVAIKKLQ